jgi:hypothetical protein
MWLIDVISVGEVNDEGVTLQEFDELTKNEKDELFKNSIQSYVQYPEELMQKRKKVAMKIISHAWRS